MFLDNSVRISCNGKLHRMTPLQSFGRVSKIEGKRTLTVQTDSLVPLQTLLIEIS